MTGEQDPVGRAVQGEAGGAQGRRGRPRAGPRPGRACRPPRRGRARGGRGCAPRRAGRRGRLHRGPRGGCRGRPGRHRRRAASWPRARRGSPGCRSASGPARPGCGRRRAAAILVVAGDHAVEGGADPAGAATRTASTAAQPAASMARPASRAPCRSSQDSRVPAWTSERSRGIAAMIPSSGGGGRHDVVDAGHRDAEAGADLGERPLAHRSFQRTPNSGRAARPSVQPRAAARSVRAFSCRRTGR